MLQSFLFCIYKTICLQTISFIILFDPLQYYVKCKKGIISIL